MKLVQRCHWQEVIHTKITALEQLGAWDKYKPEDIPAGHSTMGLRFTMRTKTNKQGVTICYKACLVVQGTNQPKLSLKDTFAPTARFSLIRLLLTIAAKH